MIIKIFHQIYKKNFNILKFKLLLCSFCFFIFHFSNFAQKINIFQSPTDTTNILNLNNTSQQLILHKDYAKAIELAQMGIKYYEKKSVLNSIDSLIFANFYNTLGRSYYSLNNYKESVNSYLEELEILKKINKKNEMLRSYFNIGTIYKIMKSNRKSVKFYEQSLALALSQNEYEVQLENYYALYETYSDLKKYDKSLVYFEYFNSLKDSLLITEAEHKINLLESKYNEAIFETAKKSKELTKTSNILIDQIEKNANLSFDTAVKSNKISLLKKVNKSNIEDINQKTMVLEFQYKSIQDKNNLINVISIALIVVISLSLVILFQIKRTESALKQSEEDNKKIRNQSELIEKQSLELNVKNTNLNELNTTKDKFLSIIAHDLRNPFSNIINLSDLLRMKYSSGKLEKFEFYLDSLRDVANQGYDLLEKLLTWAKSQSGKIQPNITEFSICDMFNESNLYFESSCLSKKITSQYQCNEDCIVNSDYNMLQTILRNLINNAIKFTPKGGKIDIIAIKNNDNLEISVQDSGVGISEDIKIKLFKIGYSVTTEGTENERGSGLGLILTNEFVSKLNGNITVESSFGMGSVFSISIPLNLAISN